jgi:methionyl-tRNA formyltransferase
MRVAFLGTPEFALPALSAIGKEHEIALVVTAPPRPRGRGQRLQPSPVHAAAERLSLPVLTPERLDAEAVEQIAAVRPDVLCVVAYGKILPSTVFDRWTCLNVHPSLLPRHRGAAPVQWTIWEGDPQAGVSIMRIVKELDAGPVFLQEGIDLHGDETAGELLETCAQRGGDLLAQALRALASGQLPERPQEGEATYARMLRREDERLDFSRPAAELARQVRALSPRPGVRVAIEEKGLELRLLRVRAAAGIALQGEMRVVGADIALGCGEGLLVVSELQIAGGKPQSAEEFLRGRPWVAGLRVQ